MKKLIIKVIGVLVLMVFLIYLFYSPRLKFDVLENPNKDSKNTTTNKDFKPQKQNTENKIPKKGVGTWIGKNISHLTNKFGQANRIYPYQNGFKNYVFRGNNHYYVVTTKKGVIKSVYATGKNANVSPLKIKDSASSVFEHLTINPEPTIHVNGKKYDLELSDEDMKTQTLVKFGKMYAQVYIDQQSNKIIGVRFLDSEALNTFKPYQTVNTEDTKKPKEDALPYEQNANQLMTLYEITNEMRKLKGLKPLKVNNQLSHIASYNLYDATGSDSVEFTEDALKQQLNAKQVPFVSTSQNVGYEFNDVPTLIHSWMNSDIHRSRMLNTKYNQMGGDVMDEYYTLIFIKDK
ncbi:SCP-like extracellular protein [Staphylococcus sp. 18_1_E_LY]|uniref:SCP-like extracellular protein n=1 Tax=Staphylococcus lloydii TaxID=2781774 RepID=A0A7T1AYD1_9STAP|nr:CAP domain-containing protein [Staphylococcus lloydii]MBF7018979.1 SCP-like extracellular protein [Staphylococcus lloydii]MBF7026707.1 SCP-like extracellular protein [Staphylococcus lloydii]QPM74366.1 SCP-like extracellular protein [Staphylococcus lloydii]